MNSIYAVSQVNAYIKNMFSSDFLLRNLYIRGEVSNCKYHTSGHLYFSLKDENGAISCVMFASSRSGLTFRMKDGDKVVAGGNVAVYERDGRYQLYAKTIRLEGAGALYERFLALKKELEEMGMFDREYKRPIPRFISRLGVVTAPTGAAIQDIRNIALRRNPYLQIILCPALVQGDGAKESIVRGIRALDQLGVDVIIVGRGGGSIEDLWAFNEEVVARAVFDCATPIISAVGHETDVTISDYAADLRAPTPSAAAELAVFDYREFCQTLADYQRRMEQILAARIELERSHAEAVRLRLEHASPANRIQEDRQRLMDLEEKLQQRMQLILQEKRRIFGIYVERMRGLSPLEKLRQGYAYVEGADGTAIHSIEQLSRGDAIAVRLIDGTAQAEVKKTVKEQRYGGETESDVRG